LPESGYLEILSSPVDSGPMLTWLAILVLAVVAVAVAVVALRRSRLHPVREVPLDQWPVPRYPVVLTHGILGFGDYFRGVAQHLRSMGVTVYLPRLPPLGSVPERAQRLAEFIASLPHERVNVIAHSMGGLDIRYAVAHCGLAARVASIVTIGTPHRGTPIADLSSVPVAAIMRRMLTSAGLDSSAIPWLTTERAHAFNENVPNVAGVLYGCVIGYSSRLQAVNPLLLPGHYYLRRCAGDNDGLVPASSQLWGELFGEIHADHWAQIGWSIAFDAGAFYEGLLRKLGSRGM
jgi:triacylglycerol lipase